jgi:hypothetical protein
MEACFGVEFYRVILLESCDFFWISHYQSGFRLILIFSYEVIDNRLYSEIAQCFKKRQFWP